jgi:hypothetical protein
VHGRRVSYGQRGQDVGDGVENLKTFVNRNLEDGGCRIDRAVDGADAFAVPAPQSYKKVLNYDYDGHFQCESGYFRNRAGRSDIAARAALNPL